MTVEAPRILVVEDEPQIRRFVRDSFTREGWQATEAGSVAGALAVAGKTPPDVVVLDLGLPDRDGASFIREFRLWSQAPIIVLSARSAERDKIDALDAGADDYLAKPFGIAELLARVRAALRRRELAERQATPFVRIGDISIDHLNHRVEVDGQEVRLTPIEYRLLAVLSSHVGRVMTHRQLLLAVWGEATPEASSFLRVHVGNLRRKIEAEPARPRHILTEIGTGYRLVGDVPP